MSELKLERDLEETRAVESKNKRAELVGTEMSDFFK